LCAYALALQYVTQQIPVHHSHTVTTLLIWQGQEPRKPELCPAHDS
jgi:hypothetical protein